MQRYIIYTKSSFTCFSEISLARTLEEERTSMAVSSSRMLPSDEDSTSRILSSISFNCLWGTMERERGLVALYIHVQHRERLRLRQKWIDCVVIILHSVQKNKTCVNCTCSANYINSICWANLHVCTRSSMYHIR